MINPQWSLYKDYKMAKMNLSESIPPEEIRAMRSFHFLEDCLRDLSFPNHILFVWVTEYYMQDCCGYMNRLGYRYYARFIWAKKAANAQPAREYLKMYYKGIFLPFTINFSGPFKLMFTGSVKTQESKPAAAYKMIDDFYPYWSKLQIFGWTRRPGWSVFHQNDKKLK
jgi:N6-adenosine-specific RNA methylase IME4